MIKTVFPAVVHGSVKAPSSKSYAQRAIAAALLAQGESRLVNMELCSDTAAALAVAELLGATAVREGDGIYRITGGLSPRTSIIDIGESGLSARMFTPIASLARQPITITGQGTIARRPMDMITVPLRNLGIRVETADGCLPVTVCGPLRGGETDVDGSVSSQFITGLLMALPLADEDTLFRVTSPKSLPYIDMTLDVLEQFGIEGKHNDYTEFFVESGQRYIPREYSIEGDWSAASCLLVGGAVAGGRITVHNLNPVSKQADIAIIDALACAGAGVVTTDDSVTVVHPEEGLRAFTFDATHTPDLFPALVALAANCDGVSEIRGTKRLIHKESHRAGALRQEFGKMGIVIDISEPDLMRITGGRPGAAALNSHDDHRIAMATAVAALCADGPVSIDDAEAVDKSYPAFWDDLAAVTGNAVR